MGSRNASDTLPGAAAAGMPEQVLGVVLDLRDEVDFAACPARLGLLQHIAQHRIVLERETNRVKYGDLLRALTALLLANQHAPQINHREVSLKLLDVALDTGLRLVLYEHPCVAQHIGMQFRLPGQSPPQRSSACRVQACRA